MEVLQTPRLSREFVLETARTECAIRRLVADSAGPRLARRREGVATTRIGLDERRPAIPAPALKILPHGRRASLAQNAHFNTYRHFPIQVPSLTVSLNSFKFDVASSQAAWASRQPVCKGDGDQCSYCGNGVWRVTLRTQGRSRAGGSFQRRTRFCPRARG